MVAIQKIKFGILIIAVIIAIAATGTSYGQPASDSTYHLIHVIDHYNKFVQQLMKNWELPGCAVAIVKNNKIVYINAFGVRKIGQNKRVTIHTIFRLASVSKGFASVLTGLLVQDGKLNWDDKVVKYVPRFALKNRNATRSLTIRHLLSHTSGLPAHTFTNLLEEDLPITDIYRKLRNVPLAAPVGKYYGYQNVIYNLIADIIKSATGSSYEELVMRRIFKPLGMVNASIGMEVFTASTNRAMPHIRRNSKLQATRVKAAFYKVPAAAGVNASIMDMARWLRALLGGAPEIIPPQVIRQVTRANIRTPREKRKACWRYRLRDAHYGLGWRIYDYAGTTIVYHGGWVEGFRSEIGFIPDHKIGVVVLLNCESRAANLFLPTFFDMYLNLSEFDSVAGCN